MTTEHDLFGHPVPSPAAFRKDGRRRRAGYAARPGTGPKGQRCITCLHCELVTRHGDSSHKCRQRASEWRHDELTDIHPNAPACREWTRKPYVRCAI